MPHPDRVQTPPTAHCHDRVEVSCSLFTGSSGIEEFNFMLRPVRYGHFSDQLEWLDDAMTRVLDKHNLNRESIVFRRFFCTDLPNQIEELNRHPFSSPEGVVNGAVSIVTQPPVAPAKATLWVYCVRDPNKPLDGIKDHSSFTLKRGDLEHVWTTGVAFPLETDSYLQTHAIFDAYKKWLGSKSMSLEKNCQRTWFYVKDVDADYDGLVAARNEVFGKSGLTRDTHYIASTGIQGSFTDIHALVMMDAYAIKGLLPEQVEHLQALKHLSHTHLYGVAFERATSIAYADRKHVLISGTASINAEGEVVHTGDVLRQLDRTLENISALLERAQATLEDMQHFIVYLRDPSDAGIIRDILKERIGDKPFLVVTGPVCRPGWLVEIEGVAIVHHLDKSLPAF